MIFSFGFKLARCYCLEFFLRGNAATAKRRQHSQENFIRHFSDGPIHTRLPLKLSNASFKILQVSPAML